MANKPRYSGNWNEVDCTCDILNKRQAAFNYVMYMFDRSNQMFEYKNLPETIPHEMLELYLQMNGHVCITEINGELYALPGGLGGAPDPYYRPTLYIVANPGLGISRSLSIKNHLKPFAVQSTQGECVLIKNDTLYRGLFPMCTRFATELAENDVSVRSAQINSRQQTLISASTESEIASANMYFKNLEEGKTGAVAEKPFLEGVTATNVSVQSANVIIQLIELQQYLKASWFNEIGLNANFNMKREYLSEEELRASTDILLPLIDNMLSCRQEALDLVNSTYGTNIEIYKNSAWLNKQNELDVEEEQEEAQADLIRAQVESAGGEISPDIEAEREERNDVEDDVEDEEEVKLEDE